ncbi:hypothetical protein GH714_010682 [Hevea brasiliensis]|uniref:Uncharacterized protein n=1 Tax=Hevea brasiliensis TaxID=3981 RepID=A0A6A6MWR7_HEVBR|nr:hypothetical protein GH714_010682 [Hevea brasiliensis]
MGHQKGFLTLSKVVRPIVRMPITRMDSRVEMIERIFAMIDDGFAKLRLDKDQDDVFANMHLDNDQLHSKLATMEGLLTTMQGAKHFDEGELTSQTLGEHDPTGFAYTKPSNLHNVREVTLAIR